MKICGVTLTVQDLAGSVQFYRDILGLRVEQNANRAVVHAGASQLTLVRGNQFDGVHHVAFGIVPSEFELAHTWLCERVSLIAADGSQVIVGPTGWNSRSLYFLGPEDIILELIARDADVDAIPGNGESPRILSISEIGIGVTDVPATVQRLSTELALPPFGNQGEKFAPVGNHDGLLIVVDQERIWFPTRSLRPARGPLDVHIETPIVSAQIHLTPATAISTTGNVP